MNLGEIKVELQVKGVSISEKVRRTLVKYYNVPHLEYNKILLYYIDEKGRRHPVYTYVDNINSPYNLLLDDDENLSITLLNNKIDVYISKKPKYYDVEVKNKRSYEIANIEANGHLAITLNHFCVHFHNKRECKFCSIKSWVDNKGNTQEELLSVIKMAYDMRVIEHISLTTGTVNNKDKGIKGMLIFIEKLDKLGINVPIACEFEPVDDLTWLDKLKEYSVKTVSCNIEILEEDIRRKLMPGKGIIPRNAYYNNWDRAVELFGKNQVYTNVIFSEYNKDFNKIRNNLDSICKIGVIPSTGLIYPEKNTELWGCSMPNVDFIKSIQESNIQSIINHKLNPIEVKAGCPRNGAYSPIKEYFLDYAL